MNVQLKGKEEGRNQDYRVSQMNNYDRLKDSYKKQHKKITEINKNVDFKIEENSTVTNLGNTDISFSPNIIANAIIQYKPIKNLQLNLNNQYIGKQYLDNTETQSLQLNDYFLTDFNAQYEFKIAKQEVSLQFLLNNIFDKKYVNNGFVYDGPYYYAQAGRNFMLGLNFRIN